MSFAIKSSHKFVNPAPDSAVPEPTYFYDSNKPLSSGYKKSAPTPAARPQTETESFRQEGSASGLVIRTTVVSTEDYY